MKAKLAIFVAAWSGLVATSFAADLPKLVLKAPVVSCTVSMCSGIYAGVGLGGLGDNLNVLGNGVAGSINSGGMVFDGHAGYRLWNGTYFFAVEGRAGIETPKKDGADQLGGSNRFQGMILGKLGLGLQGLFGTPATVPTPGTSTLDLSALASSLLSPYVIVGERWRGTQSMNVMGAGTEFLIPHARGVTLALDYINTPAQSGKPGDNEILLSVRKNFGM